VTTGGFNSEAADDQRKAFAYKSDDQGKSFVKLGGADIERRSFDEHMILELKSGRLAMFVRTEYGIGVSYSSDGGFDITVGGVTEQWDFHAPEGEAKIPDEDTLAEAVKHINYRNIAIEGNRVRLTDPETKLDLGGIAKGYIGDRMTELLESKGVTSAVINLGGNVICIGGKTDEDGFAIGVEAPFSDRTEIIGKIDARDKTLVTSGVYERQIEVDGKRYHHILDTRTGWPVSTDLDAVTLIADKGRSGDIDALSTICLIKGADEGMEFIEKQDGVEGVFVLSDGSIRTTDGAGLEAVK
jgi:thiamine biosynthesis lipoprotein